MSRLMLRKQRIAVCVLALVLLAVMASLRKEYSGIGWNLLFSDKSLGTSLLRKVIAAANNMDPVSVTWKERFHVREVKEGYDKAVLFFFAREPYSRLLSSYLSKLWLPNLEYWSAVGGPAIAIVRDNPTMAELACGSDVTFAELIRYVISSMEINRKVVNYFTPSYQVCQVCHFDYDYIGHMETFSEDARYILSAVNLTVAPKYGRLEDDGYDTIDSYVYLAFVTIAYGKGRCISRYQILLRMWRALQMQGLISTKIPFPLRWDHTKDLKRIHLNQLLHEAHNTSKRIFRAQDELMNQSGKPGSRDRMWKGGAQLLQRKMALASAWSTVVLEDRVRIRELFHKEFQLFGYDPFLEEVFAPTVKVDQKIFDLNNI
ncbi:hypothetical protein ACOMHN_039115 [Nucella lapillus]